MSDSRILSDEHQHLVLRHSNLLLERKRFTLRRSGLESSITLFEIIIQTILTEDELTEELFRLLSEVSERQANAYGRLAGRERAEKWLDVVVTHTLQSVTEEVLR